MRREMITGCEIDNTIDDATAGSRAAVARRTRKMLLLLLLCVLALPHDATRAPSSSPGRVDDAVLKFLVDATPALFPPSRIFLHSCVGHGKFLELATSDERPREKKSGDL